MELRYIQYFNQNKSLASCQKENEQIEFRDNKSINETIAWLHDISGMKKWNLEIFSKLIKTTVASCLKENEHVELR